MKTHMSVSALSRGSEWFRRLVAMETEVKCERRLWGCDGGGGGSVCTDIPSASHRREEIQDCTLCKPTERGGGMEPKYRTAQDCDTS